MQFGFSCYSGWLKQFLELSEQEFGEIRTARERVFDALSIEEKLNLVLENYAEYEEELLRLTNRHMLFPALKWSSSIGNLQLINRRLANLLSAGRLYADQVKHDVSKIYGKDTPAFKQLEQAFASAYDTKLGYRVIDALRNFIQHRSLPVHQISFPANVLDLAKPQSPVMHSIVVGLKVKELREEGGFKESVLKELEQDKEMVDLKRLVRGYIAGIGQVHTALRSIMAKDVEKWEATVREVVDRFTVAFGSAESGMFICARDDRGFVTERHSVFLDPMTRRKELEHRNCLLGHYERAYVSSEIVEEK